MLILAAINIVLGIVLVFLSKKSKRFEEWANKDFHKSLKEQEKLKKKVQIGKVTLPITYGDTLALKVLGVIAIYIGDWMFTGMGGVVMLKEMKRLLLFYKHYTDDLAISNLYGK